jgi:putative sterol carrier protein
VYHVAVAGGGCTIRRRGERPPTVTLDIEPVPFLRLVAGAVGAPSLLLSGKMRVTGDLLLAARLPRLLNVPRAPR